jgi:hypothetical protein
MKVICKKVFNELKHKDCITDYENIVKQGYLFKNKYINNEL